MKKEITILSLLLATIFVNAQFVNQTSIHGLINNYTTCFAKTTNNDLWIGTTNGISKYSSGNYTGFNTSNGLINSNIKAVFKLFKTEYPIVSANFLKHMCL